MFLKYFIKIHSKVLPKYRNIQKKSHKFFFHVDQKYFSTKSFTQVKSTAPRTGQKKTSVLNTAFYIASLILLFSGLSYAAVPLYKVFCAKTGFGGTPKIGGMIILLS